MVRMEGKDYLMATAPTDQSAEVRPRWLEFVPGTFAAEQAPRAGEMIRRDKLAAITTSMQPSIVNDEQTAFQLEI